MSHYCTHCGEKTSRRVCPACGVKQYTHHFYCEWCGEPVTSTGKLCPNCREWLNTGYIQQLMSVISFVVKCYLALRIALFYFGGNTSDAVLYAVAFVLLLGVVKNAIRKLTLNAKWLRFLITPIRLAIVVLIMTGNLF